MAGKLVAFLRDRGFEAVDNAPGWATDGEHTVLIDSRPARSPSDLIHEVRIYAGSADSVDVTGGPLARTRDRSHELALRRAFDELEEVA